MEQNVSVVYQEKGWFDKANSQKRWCSHAATQRYMDAQWELGCHVDALLILLLIHSGLKLKVPET